MERLLFPDLGVIIFILVSVGIAISILRLILLELLVVLNILLCSLNRLEYAILILIFSYYVIL